MVFNKNTIEYDDNTITYDAHPISNICFFNNTVYVPSDSKIIGINLMKNAARESDIDIVDETSKLKFTGKGFRIYKQNSIYDYC